MKVLYVGSPFPENSVLKRLMVLADEIGFIDHPSVSFGLRGQIGVPTPARHITTGSEAVVFSAHDVPNILPEGAERQMYEAFLQRDFDDPEYRRILLDGFEKSESFAKKLIQLDGNYRGVSGTQIRQALLADHSLVSTPMSTEADIQAMFKIDTSDDRADTLRLLIEKTSATLTAAMIVSDQTGLLPVTDEEYTARLLARRMEQQSTPSTNELVAPFLSFEVAKCAVPDELLENVQFEEIVEYREKAIEPYRRWSEEIEKLSDAIDTLDPSEAVEAIPNLLREEVIPQIRAFRDEMAGIRDNMWGEMVNRISRWEIPTMSIGYLSSISPLSALGPV